MQVEKQILGERLPVLILIYVQICTHVHIYTYTHIHIKMKNVTLSMPEALIGKCRDYERGIGLPLIK